MQRTMVLPLPGNSTKEQSFYEQHSQPVMPGVEWPGPSSGGEQIAGEAQPSPDPSPFKLTGGR